jgi:hypothetical protein
MFRSSLRLECLEGREMPSGIQPVDPNAPPPPQNDTTPTESRGVSPTIPPASSPI